MASDSSSPVSFPDSPLARKLVADRRYFGFLVFFLVVISAMGSFVNDMYTPALPGMCRFFGCSVPLGQMGLTMGMIGLGLGQTVLGPVSDKYGRKPVLIVTTVIFIFAAVASVFAPNIHIFNLCRFFQGIGASSGYFLAKTIPADVYGGRQLARLMALVGAINGVAPATSPVIGGIMADEFGWKSIFILLAVFAVVIILLSMRMKESLPASRAAKGSLWLAFKGYGCLLRNKPFMIHVSLKSIALGFLFAYISSSPFIMQTHYGLSQTQYGLIIGLNAIFMAAGSMVSLKFRPYKKAAFIGVIIVAAGVAAEAFALYRVHSLWLYDILMMVILFALGMIIAASNTLAMNEGRLRSGEASAIIGLGGYIVGAVVSPLVGVGNILHSSAVVNVILVVLMILPAILVRRLPADLGD